MLRRMAAFSRAAGDPLRFLVLIAASVCPTNGLADVFNMPSGLVSLQFANVGDVGNISDNVTHFGGVPYAYQIGKFDVTIAQYTEFLNAVAAVDPYGLYRASGMHTGLPTAGISRSGDPGNYSYTVIGNGNFPAVNVSWGDAARFSNWLSNGQPSGPMVTEGPGTTETGSYTLNGAVSTVDLMAVTRNQGATFVIPSESEWFKAAFYKGGSANAGYWHYPTQSDSKPSNQLSATGTNNANFFQNGYSDPINLVTHVGSFTGSPGPYGTYDQGGNVPQWTERTIGTAARSSRGGAYFSTSEGLFAASTSGFDDPATLDRNDMTGFRIVSLGPFLPGDFNRDGHVSAADIPVMLTALTDLKVYKNAQGLNDSQLLAIGDVDHSGALTNADAQALLTLLKNGGGSATAVPEPRTIFLLLIALAVGCMVGATPWRLTHRA